MMEEVLAKIKPDNAEQRRFKAVISDFIKKLNTQLKDSKAILGGSGAKDTWLKENHDIDIFVVFPVQKYARKSSSLSEILEKKLKLAFPKIKINRVHGSRDYFQLIYQDFNLEVVPILKINSAGKASNITDISPLHSSWVNKKTKKVKDDIRLAKQFCMAHNLYGAESYIAGFSGYVLEILTARYGSFQKVLQASQNWKVQEVIDAANHYSKGDALFQMNKSKLQSPLIVVDPVDKSRNAAAALSLEKFVLFKKIAKQYLKKPHSSLFEKEIINFEQIKKEATRKKQNLVFFEPLPLAGKEDVIGFKLRKAFLFIEESLQPFVIKKSGWDWDRNKKVVFYFVLQKKQMPKFSIHQGPPLKMKDAIKNFKKKYQKTFTKENRIYTKIPIKYPKLEDFLENVIKHPEFKKLLKKINQVRIV